MTGLEPDQGVPSDRMNGGVVAWLPALRRLDHLLDLAVRSTLDSSGPAPFRGLYLDREQVNRLLAREVGAPWFPLVQVSLESTADDLSRGESALARIVESFGLSPFDADVVLLALAPEIDLRYEKIYAYLQDDVTRKRPTVELALNLLCSSLEEKLDRRVHFSAGSMLLRQGLLHLVSDPNQAEPSSLAHYLKLDDQIKRKLLGETGLDDRLASFCQLADPQVDWDSVPLDTETRQALGRLILEAKPSGLRLYFQGRSGPEKREAAEALAATLGTKLLVAKIDRFPETSNPDLLLSLLVREAQLHKAVLFVSTLDDFRGSDAFLRRRSFVENLAPFQGITIFAGKSSWDPHATPAEGVVPIEFEIPGAKQRYARWESEMSRQGASANTKDVEVLAGRFRLTPFQIKQAVASALASYQWRKAHAGSDPESTTPSLDELSAAARGQCGQELSDLAHKIEPRYSWDDLILSPDPKAQLQEICFQAESRPLVYEQWGFDRKLSLGKGLNVLFAGPPGTGKTMAAEVIAHELRLDLYRIDLSQVVSKYIGETEKNLDRIFTAAENSNAILFFDEADALFGKRSEVRDSHDRYANIEISYLLQKMEEYQGISVLATNLRQNLDDAFVRRLQAIVEFPFPDEEYRRRIWENVFPQETPVAEDVRFDLLAREVRLAGGNIKNMAVAAAFYAAADGGLVRIEHLIHAARREHQKLARSWNPGELLKVITVAAA
ncbi:MAG TPA: AAA family ATPase [Candidatus Sulfotelmatobacter sp.]|nr:AAA family ATPase [Candidatus Sulfotelmatobacter sp.]